MNDPADNRQPATRAAERWRRRSTAEDQKVQVEDLKNQIIATFRLQRSFAFQLDGGDPASGRNMGHRRLVQDYWANAFKVDPIPDFDWHNDNTDDY